MRGSAIKAGFTSLVARIEEALYPRARKADRANVPRPAGAAPSRFLPPWLPRRLLQRVLTGAMSAGFIVAFVYAVYYYSTTRLRIEAHPLVTNLTKAGLTARINFGVSPRCGDAECWVRPDFDDAAWQVGRVPLAASTPVHSLPGFKEAGDKSFVYYRMRVPVPAKLVAQPDEISFSPVYVSHTTFEAYINGRLVYTSSGAKILGSTFNLPIPRGDVVDGHVFLTIKGTHDPDQPGLANRASAYIGPKPLLDEIFVHAERAGMTYHLLFLLSKGGIFVVFTLFFLFSGGQRGLYSFLVFSFFATIENLFIGDFLDDFLNYYWRDAGVFLSKTFAALALVAYFIDFFEIRRKRRILLAGAGLTLPLVTALLADYGWGTQTVTIDHLFKVTNTLLLLVISFGLLVGPITSRMWRREGINERAVKNLRNLSTFLLVYFALMVWELGFNVFYGFDKRALFDLLLFYYMAFITARDFGFKEGQITTLEAHMIEKRRMELELQEAAQIARMFLPAKLPTWPDFAVRSFHKALTENSGDWFAFETSRSGNLLHFLMCDITGHGAQAALVVSSCRTVLSLLVRNNPEVLEQCDFVARYAVQLNGVLHGQGEGQHVSTYLGLTFDRETGRVHYAAGGHPPPLHIQAAQPGRPAAMVSRNTLLGILPEVTVKMASAQLAPGDMVLAYTDGLPLGANAKVLREVTAGGGLAGETGLAELYKRVWEAQTSKEGQPPNDDVSVVAFTYRPQSAQERAG